SKRVERRAIPEAVASEPRPRRSNERHANYTATGGRPRARFLLPHLSAVGGEQNQIDHRRKRPHGGNDARRAVEIEKMPLLPECERRRHVGIGGARMTRAGAGLSAKPMTASRAVPGTP